MNERSWKIAWLLTGIGTLSGFIRISFGVGYLSGCLVGLLLYKRNEVYWSGILDGGRAARGTGFLHFLVNYGMMAALLVLAAFFPEYLNIFACAIGMMVIKFTSLIDALL